MTKKILIGLFGIVIILGTILIVLQAQRAKVSPLEVVSTKPVVQSIHYPFSPIEITFNRPLKPGEVAVDIQPNAEVIISVGPDSKTLVVTPKSFFQGLTEYQLVMSASALKNPYTFQFKTDQTTSNPPGWNELFNESFADYRAEHGQQDDGLQRIRKSAPIVKDKFTVSYNYKNDTYTFTLKKPYDQSKQDSLDWFASQGVKDLSNLRVQWVEK